MSNKNQTVLVYLYGNSDSGKDEIMKTFFQKSNKDLSNVKISDSKGEYSAKLNFKGKKVKLKVKDMGCQIDYIDMLNTPSAYAFVYNSYKNQHLINLMCMILKMLKKIYLS